MAPKQTLPFNEKYELTTTDTLTGILNRRAFEQQINALAAPGCALLVGDLDNFKAINDRYGHLEGDRCLQKAVELLGYMVRQNDLIGRAGGDEFVIFLPATSADSVQDLCSRIQKRFRSQSKAASGGIGLSISISGTMYQDGDNFQSMFARAQQLLQLDSQNSVPESVDADSSDNWLNDSEKIHRDLVETISTKGAYCQDYETFKSIYRFLERCMLRNQQKACVILLSLTDEAGNTLTPQTKEDMMNDLGRTLHRTLRMGDVYTRYSSCQYLALVIDTTEDTADMIANRLKNTFLRRYTNKDLLIHYCYQLKSPQLPE